MVIVLPLTMGCTERSGPDPTDDVGSFVGVAEIRTEEPLNLGYSMASGSGGVLVGAPGFGQPDISSFLPGRGYVFDRASDGLAHEVADSEMVGLVVYGEHVAWMGDVDDDGADDVAIGGGIGFGIYTADRGTTSFEERVGGIHDRRPEDVTGTELPIKKIHGLGDLDGDGVDDALVTGVGAFLFQGPVGRDSDETDCDAHVVPTEPVAEFWHMASGDDGQGSRWYAHGPSWISDDYEVVRVFFGDRWNATGMYDSSFREFASGCMMGASVAGTGADQLVVGSHVAGPGRVDLFDVESGSLVHLGRLTAPQGAMHFGFSAHAADFDGDGQVDLAVGAPAFYTSQPGNVYIYNGPVDDGDVPSHILQGIEPGEGFGRSLGSLPTETGEVLFVGSPGFQSLRGRVTQWGHR